MTGSKRPWPLIPTLFSALMLFSVGLYLLPLDRWLYPEWPAQWPGYHRFADTRTLFGIPNALNVLTSIALVPSGAAGLSLLLRRPRSAGALWEWRAWAMLFLAVLLTGLGSAVYHRAPSNATLFWDRLPMAVAFMALLCLVIGERCDSLLGKTLLTPSLLAGIASALYWRWSELAGAGDLRPFLLIQGGTMLFLPLLIGLCPCRDRGKQHGYLLVLGAYGAAKLFELGDRLIWTLTGQIISGHSLKHLAGALACYGLFRLAQRVPS